MKKYLSELIPPQTHYYLNEKPDIEVESNKNLFSLTNRYRYNTKIKAIGKIYYNDEK